MIYSKLSRSLYPLTLVIIFSMTTTMVTVAQSDSNAQFITMLSGALSSEHRDIEVPVEVGVLRLQFSVKYSGELDLKIITPLGNPLTLSELNIVLTDTKEKRTISIWDPKPGAWKMRLTGKGTFEASVNVQGELYISYMQFFGRNSFVTMERVQPVSGARQHAQVYTSGNNIDTIEFQLINEQGDLIAPVKFRQTDLSSPLGFSLIIETPEQPFRVLARGRDTHGKSFQRVFSWLVMPQPIDSNIAQTENSPQAIANLTVLQESSKGVLEGEQKIIRARVQNWSDELMLSGKGHPLGIRLTYSILFPVEGSYSPYPKLYPEHFNSSYTAALSMRVINISVEPKPGGIQNPDQLFFGSRATFKPDVTYTFTVDLVPNYVAYSDQKRSFCVQTKVYTQQGMRDRFEREVTSKLKLRYRVAISGTDLDGPTPTLTHNAYVPNQWYQGYHKEGVTACQ
jgi:hypothetical protein